MGGNNGLGSQIRVFYGTDNNGKPNPDESYVFGLTSDGKAVMFTDQLDGHMRVFSPEVSMQIGKVLMSLAQMAIDNAKAADESE